MISIALVICAFVVAFVSTGHLLKAVLSGVR